MKIVEEFKQFALKGNVVDLAIGIVIGGAFGKIISSLVNDIIMPPIGMLLGGVNFTALKITLKPGTLGSEAVAVNYGVFLQTVIDFLIIAWAIFLVIKMLNSLKKEEEAKPAPASAPTNEEILLAEIRDTLKKQGRA